MTTHNGQAHTPGPWEWQKTNEEGQYFVFRDAVGEEGGGVITRLVGTHKAPANKANARLIAAAPELLEALEKALPVVLGGVNMGRTDPSILRDMETAIAKAKGESWREVMARYYAHPLNEYTATREQLDIQLMDNLLDATEQFKAALTARREQTSTIEGEDAIKEFVDLIGDMAGDTLEATKCGLINKHEEEAA